MSDDRELVERLAAIDATPRAGWVAELRADLDAAWETEDPGYHLDSRRTTTVTLVDNEPTPSEPSSGRRWAILVAAAATVLLVAVVVIRDGDDGPPADQPSPTVTVPPTTPPRALSTRPERRAARARDVLRRRGRRNTDAADLRHHRRRVVELPRRGASARAGPVPILTPEDDIGFITFSRPDPVYADACHWSDGYHPGPVTTLDGLVAALTEQQGWADVTAPSDISVDGYPGKTFQRTAPAEHLGLPQLLDWAHERSRAEWRRTPIRSWRNEDSSNFGREVLRTGPDRDLEGPRHRRHGRRHHTRICGRGHRRRIALEFAARARLDPHRPPSAPTAAQRRTGAARAGDVLRRRGLRNTDAADLRHHRRRVVGSFHEEGWELTKGGPWLGEARFDEFLQHEIGFMAFSNPVAVYADACHWEDGHHPGPVDTLDGLVAALTEQQGWAEVTAPSDISIDGYVGKAFQRTAPADMSDCGTRITRTRRCRRRLPP